MLKKLIHHAWLHYILLFAGILCIAWSAIFVKLAGVSGLSSAFYRMFIGFVGVLPLWLIYRKPVYNRKGITIAVLCGFFFACDIAFWSTSIVISKASISTILANLAPVWVGFGTLLFWKQKPKLSFWIGTAVALCGVAIIVGLDQIFTTKLNMGNLLAIVAGMFYGAYLLTTQKGRVSIDTLTFTTVSMFTSSVVLFFVCLVFKAPLSGFETHSWLALAGVGLISQLGGWLAINFSLKYIKPTTASVCLLSQSVFTVLFSIPVLGEYLSWYELIGAIIVLTGIYIVNRKYDTKL